MHRQKLSRWVRFEWAVSRVTKLKSVSSLTATKHAARRLVPIWPVWVVGEWTRRYARRMKKPLEV